MALINTPIHVICKKTLQIGFILALIAVSYIIGTYNRDVKEVPIITEKETKIYIGYERLDLNWENIDFWLKYFEVKFPEIVKAQIQLESGKEFESKIAIENRNLIGMKMPAVRTTTARFVNRGHAGYPTWIHCIEDYKLWQDFTYKGGDYYDHIRKSGYAGDSTYTDKLKQIVIK